MKKRIALILLFALALGLFTGCMGTPVVYSDCTCPTEGTTTVPSQPAATQPSVEADGSGVKTGLYVTTSVTDSVSAAAEKNGEAKYDVTIVAVTVDDAGVITACAIDAVPASVKFDTTGTLAELPQSVPTKNELGADYNMVKYGQAKAEWNEQVAAFAAYVVGKTADEVAGIAINEATKPAEGTDLAASVTISIAGFMEGVKAAVANAQHMGAKKGDELVLTTLNKVSESKSATAEEAGLAQLDADIAVVTRKDGVITSCIIDSVQAKLSFDATGTLAELPKEILTKNQLGADYNMVKYGQAKAEWNEQAASFAAYVTGKTAAEVAGIAVSETTKPAEGTDLAASVTIAIGGFQALIAKALQ